MFVNILSSCVCLLVSAIDPSYWAGKTPVKTHAQKEHAEGVSLTEEKNPTCSHKIFL